MSAESACSGKQERPSVTHRAVTVIKLDGREIEINIPLISFIYDHRKLVVDMLKEVEYTDYDYGKHIVLVPVSVHECRNEVYNIVIPYNYKEKNKAKGPDIINNATQPVRRNRRLRRTRRRRRNRRNQTPVRRSLRNRPDEMPHSPQPGTSYQPDEVRPPESETQPLRIRNRFSPPDTDEELPDLTPTSDDLVEHSNGDTIEIDTDTPMVILSRSDSIPNLSDKEMDNASDVSNPSTLSGSNRKRYYMQLSEITVSTIGFGKKCAKKSTVTKPYSNLSSDDDSCC